MTRYRMLVSDRMLELREDGGWLPVEGFRLVSAGEPSFPGSPARICEFEDDGAPPEFEGQMAEVTIEVTGGVRRVAERRLARS